MSADNFIGVFSSKDSLGRDCRWYVAHGFMPDIESPKNESEWKLRISMRKDPYKKDYATREQALAAAYDMLMEESIVEYGIIEI